MGRTGHESSAASGPGQDKRQPAVRESHCTATNPPELRLQMGVGRVGHPCPRAALGAGVGGLLTPAGCVCVTVCVWGGGLKGGTGSPIPRPCRLMCPSVCPLGCPLVIMMGRAQWAPQVFTRGSRFVRAPPPAAHDSPGPTGDVGISLPHALVAPGLVPDCDGGSAGTGADGKLWWVGMGMGGRWA